MKKFCKGFLVIVFVLVSSVVAWADPPQCAEEPVYREGATWRFRVREENFLGDSSAALGNADYEVVYRGGKRVVSELTGGDKALVTTDSADELRRMLKLEKSKFEFLQFPLCVGKEWQTNYSMKLRGGKINHIVTAHSKVESAGTVEVDGRQFQGFKILRTDKIVTDTIRNYFYSPECSCLVKYEMKTDSGGKRTITLISHQ